MPQDKDIHLETACFTILYVEYLKIDGWDVKCPLILLLPFNKELLIKGHHTVLQHLCLSFDNKACYIHNGIV